MPTAAPNSQSPTQNFGREFNQALVFQVVNAYLAAGRAGTKAQKTRAEVRGGGTKALAPEGHRLGARRLDPQPHLGRRRPDIRGPAARFRQKVNRKMYRGALRSMLSELVRQDRLVVTPSFALEQPKTKLLVQQLKSLALEDVLIMVEAPDEKLHWRRAICRTSSCCRPPPSIR